MVTVTACKPSDRQSRVVSSAAVDRPAALTPFLARVDHVLATSPKAEVEYDFFRDSLGFAGAWPYRNYGDFASGGLSVGNTVLEFVTWRVGPGEIVRTEWKSVAFEPVGNTETAIAELDKRGISHSPPDVNLHKDATGKAVVDWTNTLLTGLSPSEAVFICDYADRKRIAQMHQIARDELVRRNGGPLGVIGLKEIVIGVADLVKASVQWRSLSASREQESHGIFAFADGPGIRLVQAQEPGIKEAVISVRSLVEARRFLAARGLLEPGEGQRVSIARMAIGGLHVTLVDN
jgi:hypothetical protein